MIALAGRSSRGARRVIWRTVTSVPPPGTARLDARRRRAAPAGAPRPATPPTRSPRARRPAGRPSASRRAGRPRAGRRGCRSPASPPASASTIVLGIVVIVIAGAVGASTSDPPPGVNIGLTIVQNIALVGAALHLRRARRAPARRATSACAAAGIGAASALLLGVWVGFFVLSAIWARALELDEQQTLPDELGVKGSPVNALAVVVLVTVVAPLGEELFFRGFFFGALRNWRGSWPRRC